jgi:hypothetical protein
MKTVLFILAFSFCGIVQADEAIDQKIRNLEEKVSAKQAEIDQAENEIIAFDNGPIADAEKAVILISTQLKRDRSVMSAYAYDQSMKRYNEKLFEVERRETKFRFLVAQKRALQRKLKKLQKAAVSEEKIKMVSNELPNSTEEASVSIAN